MKKNVILSAVNCNNIRILNWNAEKTKRRIYRTVNLNPNSKKSKARFLRHRQSTPPDATNLRKKSKYIRKRTLRHNKHT